MSPDALHKLPGEAVELFLPGFGVFVHVRIGGIGHVEEGGTDVPERGRGRKLKAVQYLKGARAGGTAGMGSVFGHAMASMQN